MSGPYQKHRMGADWWKQRRAYTLVALREFTSVPLALYYILLIGLFQAVREGAVAYAGFLTLLASPGMLLVHALALVAALYHTITFFNLAPKALVVRLGEDKLPGAMIAGPHYLGWLAISAGLLWMVVG